MYDLIDRSPRVRRIVTIKTSQVWEHLTAMVGQTALCRPTTIALWGREVSRNGHDDHARGDWTRALVGRCLRRAVHTATADGRARCHAASQTHGCPCAAHECACPADQRARP